MVILGWCSDDAAPKAYLALNARRAPGKQAPVWIAIRAEWRRI
jgi:hypothetical protein